MSIEKSVGEKLHFNLQLSDWELSFPKRVFYAIYNGEGTQLKNFTEMFHVANGLFAENTEVMPNEQTVIVQYVIYEADGVTISEIHGAGLDVYTLRKDIVIPTSLVPKPFAIVASLRSRNERVKAQVASSKAFTVSVKDNKVVYEVKSNKVVANIRGNIRIKIGVHKDD